MLNNNQLIYQHEGMTIPTGFDNVIYEDNFNEFIQRHIVL